MQVAVGNGGQASLSQALNVNISGELAEGVELIAVLSDQQMPLHAGVGTRDLRDLDQVLFQVRSPAFYAGLGDMDVVFDGTTYGRYRRRLQGASVRYRTGSGEAEVVGAVSKGSWVSARIRPVEGYQGPYRLGDLAGASSGLVTPGSDRVYFDGRLLTRGGAQDYAVDYDRGTVTFTPGIGVRGDSRISVTFQIESEYGGRKLVGARSRLGLGDDRLHVGATYLREGNRGVGLADAGLPGSATGSSRQVSVFDAAYSPVVGLRLEGEVALSSLGGGGLPEGTGRRGRAFEISADLRPRTLTVGNQDLGRLGFSCQFRDRGAGFSSFGPVEPAWSEGRWGWQPESEAEGQRTGEVGLHYDPRRGIRLSAGLGRRRGIQAATRREFGLQISRAGLPAIDLRTESVRQGNGRLETQRAAAHGKLGWLEPGFRIRAETATGDAVWASSLYYANGPSAGLPDGVRSQELSWELAAVPASLLHWSSSLRINRTALLANSWRDSLRTWSNEHRVGLKEWHGLSFSGDFTHARVRDVTNPSVSRHTNLARLRLGLTPVRGGMSNRVSYRISSTGTPARQPVYAYVGPGVGTHLWEDADGDGLQDPEEVVPDAFGDYAIYNDYGGDFRRVQQATVIARTDVNLGRLIRKRGGRVGRFFSRISAEVSLDADRQVTPGSGGLAPWHLYTFRRGGEIVKAREEYRASMHVSRYEGRGSLRIRTRRTRRIERAYHTDGEEDLAEVEGLGRLRYTGLDLEAAVRRDRRSRTGEPTFAYSMRSRAAMVRAATRVGRSWKSVLRLSIGSDRESTRSLEATRLSLGPEATRTLYGSGRLRASLDWARVWSNGPVPLFLGMSEGDRPGHNLAWRVGADYRVTRLVTAMLLYNGRVRPDRPFLHIGRMELRARF